MNDQRRYWKSDLKSRIFDDSLTKEEMLAKMPDDCVDKDQYTKLVRYWCTEKAKEHMKTIMNEYGETSEVYTSWKNNIYSKVKGSKKNERVRCVAMAVGGFVSGKSAQKAYPGKTTGFVILTSLIACTSGLIFGYDAGISGHPFPLFPF
ncbi:hypothetical protein Cni_G16465 [Canna indica]|uniref:Uncharacterized protein n=1 Tax=Canna indica TaxID=4628 RepID=A0AAQ3KIR6_9LILI|nr:hypothetical protein Cni_G16465 [Canna indica]